MAMGRSVAAARGGMRRAGLVQKVLHSGMSVACEKRKAYKVERKEGP